MPWFRELSAEDRSWIGLVAQAGIAASWTWYREPGDASSAPITAEVFGTAPRELAGVVTLQQTVELVRLTIEVVEEHSTSSPARPTTRRVREAVLRYAREVAFAAAQVYARAAEARGAWDARLEALVVDALLRGEADETVRSRAAALGWASTTATSSSCSGAVPGERDRDASRRRRRTPARARHAGLDVLCGVQGDRLVVVARRRRRPDKAGAAVVATTSATGPVVVGPGRRRPACTRTLGRGRRRRPAGRAGLAGRAPAGAARRPAARAGARRRRPRPPAAGRGDLPAAGRGRRRRCSRRSPRSSTTAARSRRTARALFVHANTVRYRLRRVAEVTGLRPPTRATRSPCGSR